ncbi:MAG: flagellar biosynthesis protein FlhA [Phycisphaerales bacterium]|jgi:flagellar biosynthesis protein FlhA|nr:flagellar biosynthesis protein FlhA [Phycisphaerales bacterium]
MPLAAAGKTPFFERVRANRGMIFPIACVSLLLVLLIPLPPAALDFLLVLNLTLSVVILVTTIYVKSPREFAVFPSLLLAITLFRLVLNVATTRLILSGDGTEASAGQVVQTFSHFVTSGSLAVGTIIFLIIFVIQFVVISKGGSRISEVAARFELDSLPGKQMAIDADVNAGLITQQQAQDRRKEVAQQADFYAAMEGAGKFVRGDAIAGVIITLVNIIGGLYVGMFDHAEPMLLGDCLRAYTKLTIGDGLISQVPAFIVALAAGLIVTRQSAESDLGDDMIAQVLAKPKALLVAAVFLAILSLMGMPKLPLLILGTCCVGLAYVLNNKPTMAAAKQDEQVILPAKRETREVERLLDLDVLELAVGHGLAKLANDALLARVVAVREEIALELGILVPAITVRDSEKLGVNDYAIKIRGQLVARGVAYPDQFLAIDAGEAAGPIEHGEETADPARGRLAYWITEPQRDDAELLGYVVLDAPAVMLSHVTEVVRSHAHELLTRQAVKNLLDNLKTRASAVVEEVVPELIKPGELQKVLQNLLRERVPVRDLETILETLGDHAGRTKDSEMLTDAVRVALARAICKQYVDERDRLFCLMLDPQLEELIAGHLEHADGVVGSSINTMPPATQQQIGREVVEHAEAAERDGKSVVVLTSPAVRSAVKKLVESFAPHLAVLSLAEVVGDVRPEVVAVVGENVSNSLTGSGDRLIEDGYESANV